MRLPRLSLASSLLPCVASLCASTVSAYLPQTIPAGFSVQPIGTEWAIPVDVAFIDARHLLVAEKHGSVWLVENDIKRNKVLDLASEVLTSGDRGLLGIQVDPQFATNGYIYLLFVVDPNQDGVDEEQEAFSRLVRYTTGFDVDGNLVPVAGSRLDLLGGAWLTGIPACNLSHAVGKIRFLSDGSLTLTAGDAGHFEVVDAGGLDPDCFGLGRTTADQDVGAFRSQYAASYAGKVLRVDPTTGLGLFDNPFFTGNLADVSSRIWCKGLRNPFRFTLVPNTGPRETMIIGDVGWATWEEIDVAHGGENFGWPCFEGPNPQSDYVDVLGETWCAQSGVVTAPVLAMNHFEPGSVGFTGECISGVAIYSGNKYPELYQGRLFFCDFANNWLKCAKLDTNLHLSEILAFGSDMRAPITLESDPSTGDLVYIGLQNNRVNRIRFVGSDVSPVISAQVTPTFGALPLQVQLHASGSYSPGNGSVTFLWDLGDGTTSTAADLTKTYTTQVSGVRVTVTDSMSLTSIKDFQVAIGDTPPTVTVLSPSEGQVFMPGDTVVLSGSASDAEDDPANIPLDVQWSLTLMHDHHEHPDFGSFQGAQAQFGFTSQGAGTNLRITFEATDSNHLTTTKEVLVYDGSLEPAPHFVSLSQSTLHVGDHLHAVGHVHDPGDVHGYPDLSWDWGDGTHSDFQGVHHFQDTTPDHVYSDTGTYTITLTASLGSYFDSATKSVRVVSRKLVTPRPR